MLSRCQGAISCQWYVSFCLEGFSGFDDLAFEGFAVFPGSFVVLSARDGGNFVVAMIETGERVLTACLLRLGYYSI